MLTPGNTATTGSLQHEGIRMDSNSMTEAQMREVLEIPAPEPTSEVSAETPAPDTTETPEPEQAATPEQAKPAETKPTDKPATRQQEKKKERYEAMEARANHAERALQQALQDADRRHQALLREMDQRFERFAKPTEQTKAEPTTTADSDPEPKLEDFANEADPYAAWMRATARWEGKQQFNALRKQEQEFYQQRQAEHREFERKQAEMQRLQGWTGRMEQAFTTNPDLRVTIENMPVLPRPMMDVIIDSEIPDQILSHLVQHPEEQARIAQLHPLRQFREMSRIEYQLEQAAHLMGTSATPAKPTAHPPISPTSGSHAAPKSGEPGPDASYEEHAAYYNTLERQQRTSRR